jgi:hypothetical protein
MADGIHAAMKTVQPAGGDAAPQLTVGKTQ